MMKVLKILLLIALIPLLYVVGAILYGTLTDYKPDEKSIVTPTKSLSKSIEKDTFVLYTWNIGYAGLGKESDFFMDGGEMVRMSKEIVDKNFVGIQNTIKSWSDADFILIQEVDEKARRSYHVNQFTALDESLGTKWAGSLAYNYKVNYIPVPLLKPYGKVIAGLATYTPYASTENSRYQFPGNFGWPKRIFFLDRCFLVQRFSFKDKDLLVINTHNSAYDDGTLKAGQMAYLKDFIESEFDKGNYVIVGGDWNQCPPDHDCYGEHTLEEVDYIQSSIGSDYMSEGWKWSFDTKVKTNRKLKKAYVEGKTFSTIIDFYLTSPNIEVVEVNGHELNFEFSDHQPVQLKVKLL